MASLLSPQPSVMLSSRAEEGLNNFFRYAKNIAEQVNIVSTAEEIDRYYMLENNSSKAAATARALNRLGDRTKIPDMEVPIIMTQVESAVNYLQDMFLTGSPIFGVVGNRKYQEEAAMIEALFSENSLRAGWAANLLKAYREGIKYNLMAIHVNWDSRYLPSIQNDATMANAANASTVEWQGNVIKHIPIYNLGLDTRVEPGQVHSRGEFAYFTELVTRIELKVLIEKLRNQKKSVKNLDQAFASRPGAGHFSYYWPWINREVFDTINSGGGFSWVNWLNNSTGKNGPSYAASYELTTVYARIIPSEFGITTAAANSPQVWRFLVVNGAVIISAERITNAHGFLPIIVGQPHDDALRYQSKSIAANAKPFQDMASTLWNTHINALRRRVTDRILYDPSKVDESQINNPNPSAKIPIKPSAMGTPLAQIIYPFPFSDNTGDLINEAQAVTNFANLMNGQNPLTQGQHIKGNKTRYEVEQITGNADARNRQMAQTIEDTFHAPLKEILLTNVLQYQTPKELQVKSGKETVQFDPVAVRDATLIFKIPDGLNPANKLMGGDELKDAFNVLSTVPALGQNYDVGAIFQHLLSIRGVDISEYKKSDNEIRYQEALAAWQQAMAAHAETMKGLPPEQMESYMQQMKEAMPMPDPKQFGIGVQSPEPGTTMMR